MTIKTWWQKLDSLDREIVSVICILISLAFFLFSSCITITTVTDLMTCNRYQTFMPEENFVWDFWVGCLIETPDESFADAGNYMDQLGRYWLFVDENK